MNGQEVQDEQEFPIRITYSSPPEAATLKAWLDEVDRKRRNGGLPREPQADDEVGEAR